MNPEMTRDVKFGFAILAVAITGYVLIAQSASSDPKHDVYADCIAEHRTTLIQRTEEGFRATERHCHAMQAAAYMDAE